VTWAKFCICELRLVNGYQIGGLARIIGEVLGRFTDMAVA
jgi:hypothetical protein